MCGRSWPKSCSSPTSSCTSTRGWVNLHDPVVDRPPMIDRRLELEHPEAERSGQGDVLRLAYIEALSAERVKRHLAGAGDRGEVFFLSLGVDDPPLHVVQRDRVRCEEEAVVVPHELGIA